MTTRETHLTIGRSGGPVIVDRCSNSSGNRISTSRLDCSSSRSSRRSSSSSVGGGGRGRVLSRNNIMSLPTISTCYDPTSGTIVPHCLIPQWGHFARNCPTQQGTMVFSYNTITNTNNNIY